MTNAPPCLRISSSVFFASALGVSVLLCFLGTAHAGSEGGLDEEIEFLQEEEETIFSPAKHGQAISESPSAVTLITREEIENTFCSSVTCLLRYVPEMDVRLLKPLYSAVGARALTGDTGERVLVLVDGREINLEVFGPPFWESLPVHLEDIERIEIIRGPGSALYGANAHSAVVSITTKKISRDGGAVFVGGGERGDINLHLRLDKVFGNWRTGVSVSREASTSWDSPSIIERELNRVCMRLEHGAAAATSSLELGFSTPAGLIQLGFAPMTLRDTFLGHLVLKHENNWLMARTSFGFADATLLPDQPLYFGDVKLGELPETFAFVNTTLDSEVQVTWNPTAGNLMIAGVNHRWITFFSEANNPEETHQQRVGFFLHDEQRLSENLLLTGSVRFDYYNTTRPSSFWGLPLAFSPRLAGVWRFDQFQLIRLAVGQAFRKPSFLNTSLHFKNTTGIQGIDQFVERSIGNEDLKNESISAFEMGYRGRFWEGRLTLEGDLFFNRYRDTINFFSRIETNALGIPDLERSVLEYRNTGRDVDSLGGSIALTFRQESLLRVNVNYTYRYSFYVSEATDARLTGEGKKGERVPWEPAQLLNLFCTFQPRAGLRLGFGLHGASSTESATSKDGSPFGAKVPVRGPVVLFASTFAAWRIPASAGWFEVGVRAFNSFNQEFHDSPGVMRSDGMLTGGETLGRLVFLFVSGST